MDYHPQTMSAEDMNTHLESMLADVRKIQNAVELSIDEIDEAFAAAARRLDAIELELDKEYHALEAIDTETESEIEQAVLTLAETQSTD